MWASFGQPEVKLLSKILWPPNLVEEPLIRVEHNAGVKGLQGVMQDQPEVKLLRFILWLPNLVGRTPDQSGTQCRGEMSHRVQPGSTRC